MDSHDDGRLFALDDIPIDPRPSKPSPNAFRSSIDEARAFGGWTLNKLEVLRLYLNVYRRVAGGGTYIDGFAGDGLIAVDGEQHPGSAVIAPDSGAFRVHHLFEVDGMIQRLQERLAERPNADRFEFHAGDCNQRIRDLLRAERIDKSRACFAFLDPDSTELEWDTVEALARYKDLDPDAGLCKVELWILFNLEQAIQRLWPNDKTTGPPHGATLDRVMGGREAWHDMWSAGRPSNFLVARYCERLVGLGYAHVLPQQIRDPRSGRPQYWMIHATDHDAAVRFMRWAKKSATGTIEPDQIPGVDWPELPLTTR